ncbi:acyl CoA:acetate/3-ketoacid CoA transferase (plasmid) [Shinella sp. PSBB067]|uniref:acyl CoA:acetate/3-ketoacid CoA transferase n=1 Tax=Shinella sp. PSBB067 TaxID=2715959 RepID=UPI00193BB62C|nr:CoA-transferase [Shinella sp. PSBB067]QRI66637.1 acyl CoA:acetate/3-ketoacid CoA transferase [Shinella sp. PSBB067]
MKIVDRAGLRQVIAAISEGATVAISGAGGGLLEPETVLSAFEETFLSTGRPSQITLIHALGMGDRVEKGTNRFAYEGMVKRVIGGHWIWSPRMLRLAQENKIEAYCLPSGAITNLFREIGARRPGLFTHVGLGTFVDPRLGGGRCNDRTTEEIIELMEIDGREVLRYKPFPVHVAVVRGTFSDELGNISASEEPADLDSYSIALAAKNSGGIVIAQVREVVPKGILRPREVSIPGNLVDYVIVDPDQAQTYHGPYDLALAGLGPHETPVELPATEDIVRQIVARRGAVELIRGATVNFGFGMSAGVAEHIVRAGESSHYWFTIEQGIHGGDLLTGDLFGIAANPVAILSASEQFDLYSGGGLDQTFLGLAEMDRFGNVNVSHFGGQISGPGGFIDISQGAQNVVFCGSFDAKGARISLVDGGLKIERHGQITKLVDQVAGITFSGSEAVKRGQTIHYITERAVFRLVDGGVELIEHAPGIDVRADILDRMAFAPIVRNPIEMDRAHFAPASLNDNGEISVPA